MTAKQRTLEVFIDAQGVRRQAGDPAPDEPKDNMAHYETLGLIGSDADLEKKLGKDRAKELIEASEAREKSAKQESAEEAAREKAAEERRQERLKPTDPGPIEKSVRPKNRKPGAPAEAK